MQYRNLGVVAICLAFWAFGCSESKTAPKVNVSRPEDNSQNDSDSSLRASALQLSENGNFFMRYSVSVDGLDDEPALGAYEFQKSHYNLELPRSPVLSQEIVTVAEDLSNLGCRWEIKTDLVSFNSSAVTFLVSGTYQFRRPKVDSDKPSELPFVWEAEQPFPEQTVSLDWNNAAAVSIDISKLERFEPFRNVLGDEITVRIQSPQWSTTPWSDESEGG